MISSCEHNETWWLHTAPQGARSWLHSCCHRQCFWQAVVRTWCC
jgi:hypothetical protein